MDKVIKRTAMQRWGVKAAVVSAAVVIVTGFGFYELSANEGRVQSVDVNNLTIKTVQQGAFLESLTVRGRVAPTTSVFLDTVEGGRVEETLVEQGAIVKKGQPLLRLANASLQMEVMSREAQIAEQLNFLRNTQMEMETNRLNLRRDLLDIELKITHFKRKIRQYQPLVTQSVLAQDTLEAAQEELAYYESRKQLTVDRQAQEKTIRQAQVAQLQESAAMLQNNLKIARKNLDSLLVKSPISGYLSELDAEIGTSKANGARLGRIDVLGQYKLTASLDEFYLNKVDTGLPVWVYLGGDKVKAEVSKIDSRVVNAQFTIEIDLQGLNHKFKRGQSIEVDLVLGNPQRSTVLLPRGAFFGSSGGKWVFVVDQASGKAHKRVVTLGKKNNHHYQVLSGLKNGDKVITSSYQPFQKADTLTF